MQHAPSPHASVPIARPGHQHHQHAAPLPLGAPAAWSTPPELAPWPRAPWAPPVTSASGWRSPADVRTGVSIIPSEARVASQQDNSEWRWAHLWVSFGLCRAEGPGATGDAVMKRHGTEHAAQHHRGGASRVSILATVDREVTGFRAPRRCFSCTRRDEARDGSAQLGQPGGLGRQRRCAHREPVPDRPGGERGSGTVRVQCDAPTSERLA